MKQFWFDSSLQLKITLLLLLFILLPLLIVSQQSIRKSSDILTRKISESNQNTLIQIGSSIDMAFRDINGTTLYLPFNEEIRSFFHLERDERNIDPKIYRPLSALYLKKQHFESIYLESFKGHRLDSSGAKNHPIDMELYRKADSLRGGHFWFKSTIEYPYTEPEEVFSFIRVYNDIHTMAALGYLKVNVDLDIFLEMMNQAAVGPASSCLLINADGNVLLRTGVPLAGGENNILKKFISNQDIQKHRTGYFQNYPGSDEYLLTWYRLTESDWTLINIIPRDDILKENEAIKRYILFVGFICFLIIAPLAVWFISTSLKPLHEMSLLMGNIQDENFDVQIKINGNDEIAALGRSFNRMSTRLKQLVEQEYQARIQVQSAELKTLQEQINPHFLYNTLDTICWMCRINKDFETAELVEALSSMFRLSLNSGSDITTVRKETDHLRNYITIQSKRYENRIDFNLQTDDSLSDFRTCKMILQPLVENSIKHGIEPTDRKGSIHIRIWAEEDSLCFEVADDGCGFDPDEMYGFLQDKFMEDENRGFAVKNVNERIKLLYGKPWGLEFRNGKDRGAVVIVRQPLAGQKADDKEEG